MLHEKAELTSGPSAETFTVQQVAERTGLSVHTLRYYERIGLIARVARSESSGHRRYSETDIARIIFLKKLRATGMPIGQMQQYVALILAGDQTQEARREMLAAHRDAVRCQIAELTDNLAAIEWKIASYHCLDAATPGNDHSQDALVARKEPKL